MDIRYPFCTTSTQAVPSCKGSMQSGSSWTAGLLRLRLSGFPFLGISKKVFY